MLRDLSALDERAMFTTRGSGRGATPRHRSAGEKRAAASPSGPSLSAPPIAAPTVAPHAEATGERRHVTVMFCDLVDSTGIAAKLDAEEWRDLVGAYLDAASQAALERLGEAEILLVQGMPPESKYRFKHALIQDAAYENLLRSRRQALHRRVAEVLRDQFNQADAIEPELLARHFTQAGLTDTAIEWWGKAGQRSLERSALLEATEQYTRALALISTLPSTPALRRAEITFQVAIVTPLLHIKGYAAPETKAAAERARLLIEHAESLGEHPNDPLLLFEVLYSLSIAHQVSFNGDLVREVSEQFLALALAQGTPIPQ
jgi:hypothetical protein